MSETQQVDELANRIVQVVNDIRASTPDRDELMRTYWLESYRYPSAVAQLRDISEFVCGLNPSMLGRDVVQRRLILFVVRAVLNGDIDNDTLWEKSTAELRWLIGFKDTQELHVQLVNLFLRTASTFGNVEIHPIPNTGDTTEYHLKYEGPFGHGGPVDAVLSFAVVPRAPGLESKALHNAVEMVESVLTLMRALGLPALWGREWRQAGVAGRDVGSGWVILRRRHRSPWDMSLAASPVLAFMEFEEMIANYTPQEVREVEKIYMSERPSKMQRKVLEAMFWLGEATLPASNSSRFAKLSIAFETAVGGEAKGDDQLREIGVTEMLAERTAFLLGRDTETRLLWHRAVKKLYGSRSKVMHGELEPISDDDLTKWAFLVWKAVRAILTSTSQFTTVEQFANWLRTQRYTLPT